MTLETLLEREKKKDRERWYIDESESPGRYLKHINRLVQVPGLQRKRETETERKRKRDKEKRYRERVH